MKIIKSLVVIASFALLISCGNKSEVKAEASVDGISGKQFENYNKTGGIYFINEKQCLYMWVNGIYYRSSLVTYELKGNNIVVLTQTGEKKEFAIYNNEILVESIVGEDGNKLNFGTTYFLVKD